MPQEILRRPEGSKGEIVTVTVVRRKCRLMRAASFWSIYLGNELIVWTMRCRHSQRSHLSCRCAMSPSRPFRPRKARSHPCYAASVASINSFQTPQLPPTLICSPSDHIFLVGGLALMVMSVTCLAIPVGSLFVRWP